MEPFVSICVPTYNGEEYLKECLNSVMAQTFSNFEVLIVDDQSSDETLNMAQEYAVRDNRIRVTQNEHNLGLVGNWNRCVELAQGDWIKFVFQDDLIEPSCLEQMLAACKPETAIVCCHRDFIFEAGTTKDIQQYYLTHLSLEKLFPNSTEISANDYCEATLKHIGFNFVGEPTAVMLHRSVFYRFGTFNPHLIMICDSEFWARVAIHTGIVYVPETLAKFRVHDRATSATSKTNREYRGWVLDGLIVLHDCTFHPIYAPLRAVAEDQGTRVNLANLLANKACEALKIAERSATHSVNQNFNLMVEWQNVVHFYPILSRISKRSLLNRIVDYFLEPLKVLKQQVKVLRKLQS